MLVLKKFEIRDSMFCLCCCIDRCQWLVQYRCDGFAYLALRGNGNLNRYQAHFTEVEMDDELLKCLICDQKVITLLEWQTMVSILRLGGAESAASYLLKLGFEATR